MPEFLTRYETAIVAAIVIALTVSALLSPVRDEPLVLCLLDDGGGAEAMEMRLARVLGNAGDREVVTEWCRGVPGAHCDAVVMSVHAYRRLGRAAGWEPIASIDQPASAVVIARADDTVDVSELQPTDIIFTSPRDINGCWLQLRSVVGPDATPRMAHGELRFAEGPSAAMAVVREVAAGNVRAGAVPREAVGDARLRVVREIASLPEMLLCSRAENVEKMAPLLAEDPGLDAFTPDDSSRLNVLFDWAQATAGVPGNP